jgi:pilus assembly protein CpaB
MRKYRHWISLGLAFIVAFITSLLIYNYLQKSTRVVEVKQEIIPVATAIADIGWGTRITTEMIKPVDFLKSTIPPGCFSDGNSPVGRVAISPIKANEPILESRLAPASISTGGVAAVVSPKKRAVSVKVDKVIGVSGFIHQGNRVDVLVTIPTGKNYEPTTKTVLENILVLTVGQELEKKGKDEKPSEVDVITLEVTPEEAERLALAATEGRLQLALRNFSDTEQVLTRGVTIPTLLGSYFSNPVKEEAKKQATAASALSPRVELPAQKPRAHVVELIKGGKVSEIKFERSE